MFRTLTAFILAGVFIMYCAAASEIPAPKKISVSEGYESVIDITGTPILRIGILSGYKRIDFHLDGDYTITDLSDKPIISDINSDLRWRAKIEESDSADFTYYVLLKTFGSYTAALDLADTLAAKGYEAKIVEIGNMIRIDGIVINDPRKYRLLLGGFTDEESCDPLIDEFFEQYNPRVVRSLLNPAKGKVEFYDAEFDFSGTLDLGFRLIPNAPDSKVILHKVRIGKGFHWEDTEDRVYPGIVEIRIDHDGQLQAINEVTIDLYLKGVVPAEMPASYPVEALKAQAVAARSEVISKLGAKHLNDPYDFCATVHCQVYSGETKSAQRSSEAVVATTGEVITFRDRICDAVYSAVCGGHTENKENVWNSPAEDYLVGVFDSPSGNGNSFTLQDSADHHAWVDSLVPVHCNVLSNGAPPELRGAAKYFRWEETYSRTDLENIIRKKTKVDIGTFYGIELLKRGVSGRLIEIEILGSRRNLKIKNELNIRRSLSDTHLKSSSFYITMNLDPDGVPYEITFHGAGWGHGVGMCQVGAAVMAYKNRDYKTILAHYYTGTALKRVYTLDSSSYKRKDIKQKAEILED
ncbi:MAG: SpoIID/LytB domain-containing protein [FCB group bacterium]|nr:SpoIID/LytB domain-containing protein [FCB group bacterium]